MTPQKVACLYGNVGEVDLKPIAKKSTTHIDPQVGTEGIVW